MQPAKRHGERHGDKHKGNIQDVTSDKETPLPPTGVDHTDDVTSITSSNELTLFPPIPDDYEEQVDIPLPFETTMPEEIPIVSVHYNLPEFESTAMETAV